MKWSDQGWGCLAVMALCAVSVVDCFGDAKPNPYETIVERNPFQLRPPPPPPDTTQTGPPPAPPATVELTGITSIFQKHKALLEITPGPGKPVVRPILMEGERLDMVEVVSINVEKNEVTIKNGSIVTNLALKVSKPAGTAVAGAPPPNPFGNQFNPGIPQPGAVPGGASPPPSVFTSGNNPGNTSGRGNVMVFGGNNAAPAANAPAVNALGQPSASAYGNQNPANAALGGLNSGAALDATRKIPTRDVRVQQQQQQQPGQPVDPAIQYLQMRAQKQHAESQGKSFPPLPPIPGLDE